MSKKFKGKIALVTGGATGMCLTAAKRFVHEGMDHVFITGRRKDRLDAVMADIGKNVTAAQGDAALAVMGLALGMRHGVDPDHLAAIDGLAGTRPRATNGIYFALGHALVVMLLAMGIGHFWQVDWRSLVPGV